MIEIVKKLEKRLIEIDSSLADPATLSDRQKQIDLGRERRQLERILSTGREYAEVVTGIDEAKEIIAAGDDDELVQMAREELDSFQKQLDPITKKLQLKLLPSDPNDEKSAMVEMRAGTGGDEAGIFVGDIFRMYQRFTEDKGWKIDIHSCSNAQAGGFKEIIFSIEGNGAYGLMKWESGVHRVQRVPQTESQGRIHTSAITVAVFPEAEEVDLSIADNELKVDVFRASGPGGQSVNTTDSAVRITYIPTGLVVTCQDEKSQIKNKAKAMRVLRARLYDQILSAQREKQDAERRTMVSSGDRSAKIRTYNFPQGRVTDHRIGLTLYKLEDILSGNVMELIDPMRQHEQEERLRQQAEANS